MKIDIERQTVTLHCRRCGKSGRAEFAKVRDGDKTYWRLCSLPDGFVHNELSLGGAEVYCTCSSVAGPVYDPNGTSESRREDSD